jgi:hypothetical protein
MYCTDGCRPRGCGYSDMISRTSDGRSVETLRPSSSAVSAVIGKSWVHRPSENVVASFSA